MKTKIIIGIFLIAFSSCVTQKKCNEKFPSASDTVRIVQVRDSVVYKDKIVEIKIPGELRIDSVVIPCSPPKASYIPDTARAETSLAKAKAWWSYPAIKLKLEQKDTTIEKRLDDAIMEAYHWRTEYEKIVMVKETKYVPKIYKDALAICIIIFVLAAVLLGWKLYGFIKK
jgi:hypothetical protein